MSSLSSVKTFLPVNFLSRYKCPCLAMSSINLKKRVKPTKTKVIVVQEKLNRSQCFAVLQLSNEDCHNSCIFHKQADMKNYEVHKVIFVQDPNFLKITAQN